jgi:arylsulfatase A-like enzyme
MNDICDLPNLKRLQSIGVTFTNAFSNNPVCCPARAGIALPPRDLVLIGAH